MDLSFETEATFLNEDHSWAASRLGFDTARPATLDLDLFDEGLHFPDGFIPSGMGLARVTAAGPNQNMYGPYGGVTNETQSVAVDADGGTFTLTFDGEDTDPLAFNVTAADLRTALEHLSNLDPGDIGVTGGPGDAGATAPYLVTFIGNRAGTNVPAMVADDALTSLAPGGAGTGTVTVTTPQAGGAAVGDGRDVGSGLLLTSSRVRPTNVAGRLVVPLMWQGIVRVSRLPANHGVDAGFQTDVATIRWEA